MNILHIDLGWLHFQENDHKIKGRWFLLEVLKIAKVLLNPFSHPLCLVQILFRVAQQCPYVVGCSISNPLVSRLPCQSKLAFGTSSPGVLSDISFSQTLVLLSQIKEVLFKWEGEAFIKDAVYAGPLVAATFFRSVRRGAFSELSVFFSCIYNHSNVPQLLIIEDFSLYL